MIPVGWTSGARRFAHDAPGHVEPLACDQPFDAAGLNRGLILTTLERQVSTDTPPLDLIPLGGVGEFGMNMMVIACGDTAILVDAGVMFPEPELLGVDLVIPDLRQLQQYRSRRWC